MLDRRVDGKLIYQKINVQLAIPVKCKFYSDWSFIHNVTLSIKKTCSHIKKDNKLKFNYIFNCL